MINYFFSTFSNPSPDTSKAVIFNLQGCNRIILGYFTLRSSVNPRIFFISNSKYATVQYFHLQNANGVHIVNHNFFEFSSISMSLEIKNFSVQGISYSGSLFLIKSDFPDVAHRNSTICLAKLQILNNSLYLPKNTGTFSLITLEIGPK